MTTNTIFIRQVVTLTNQFRAANGLPALTLNQELRNTAQLHSQDMALQDYFSHTGKNGSSPWNRADMFGYGQTAMGENIAAGYSTPAAVVEGWKNSPGHRANMLSTNYTEIGVGYEYLATDTGSVNYFHYWTHPSFVTLAVEKLFLDVKLQRAEKALENPENNSCASSIGRSHALILE